MAFWITLLVSVTLLLWAITTTLVCWMLSLWPRKEPRPKRWPPP
jgi:hypothetical protein